MVLIEGTNGSGKSTLCEAILFCLFGKTERYGSSNTKVTHKRLGGAQVYTELVVDQGVLKVYRHREHSTYGNKLLLYLNDKDLSKGSDSETQKVLEDLVKMDYATFTSAVIFSQGAKGFASKNDAEMKGVLEAILGTERFSQAHERTKSKHVELNKKALTLRSTIQEFTRSLENKHVSLLRLMRSEEEFEKSKQEEIIQAEKALEILVSSEPKIDPQAETEIETLKKQTDADATSQAERLRGQIFSRVSELQQQQSKLMGRLEAWKQATKDIESEPPKPQLSLQYYEGEYKRQGSASAKVNAEIALLELEFRQCNAVTSNVSSLRRCNTCGQELSDVAKAHILGTTGEKRLKLLAELKRIGQVKKEVDAELQTAEDLYYGAQAYEEWEASSSTLNEIKNGEKKLETLTPQIETYQKQLSEIDEILEHSREKVKRLSLLQAQLLTFQSEHLRWTQQVEQKRESLSQKRSRTSPFLTLIQTEREEIAKQTSLLTSKAAFSEEVEHQLEILQFWSTGFSKSGVRGLLLDQATPLLNERAKHYASILSDGAAEIKFNTLTKLASGELREKFQVEVAYRDGAPEYDGTSGGERRRADIPCLLALSDLAASRSSAKVELRLLDEVFENLDAVGCEQMVYLLNQEVVPRTKTVLVISHSDEMKQFFDQRIIVRKENGVSQIIQC